MLAFPFLSGGEEMPDKFVWETGPGAATTKKASPPDGQRVLRQIGTCWSWLKYTQFAYLAAEALMIVSAVASLVFFDMIMEGGFSSDAEMMQTANLIDGVSAVAGIGFLVTFVLCIIGYARFFHRSMNNVQAAGDPDATMPPGWTWGYHFIPIVNLWKPLQGVLQIWRASMRLSANNPRVPATIGWWWAAWLATNFISNVSFRLAMDAGALGDEITDFDLFLMTFYLDIASSVIGIICSILLLRFSGQVRQAQQAILDGNVGDVFS